ncbi:heterokaryon incompatibility (HET) domain-containing [Fusarium albosuccineum]|uniref:Heterokaryon incompatibility (HET) domain-containing n=1 Tax=Fusarium albosuccineum TaxID=1237068 RepID=A0A8H4KZ25_9HYPO|nr:heterokaryon incompatibility (HET) domain-containing [Fusarium albosuccineum]
MAGNPQHERARLEAIASIANSQATVRQVLASGVLPVDQEISIRAQMADLLIQTYDRHEQQQYIRDAIQHLETILRRLPRDSPDRPRHLSTLSYAKMSEHNITNSRHTLDEAISTARRARELAITFDLIQRDPGAYFHILTNLGPEPYYLTLNNYASRLRMRFLVSQDPDDINEALRLVNELRSRSAPGTAQHGSAVGQLGMMSSDKFNRTGKLEDLDEALGYCTVGLEALPRMHETRVPMLRQIVELYRARHRMVHKPADLDCLVRYSAMLYQSTPPGHTARGQFLLDHLRHLRTSAVASHSLQVAKEAIGSAEHGIKDMPAKYPEREACEVVIADLYAEQYSQSHDLQDLIACAQSVRRMLFQYNDDVDRGNSSQGLVETSWLWKLLDPLGKLAQAPSDNAMRRLAEKELPEVFDTNRNSQKTTGIALEELYHQHGQRLQVLAEAIACNKTLSEDEIQVQTARLKNEEDDALRKRRNARGLKLDEYQTELGLRALAIDESKNLVMDLSNIMGDILGCDPTRTYSPEEFMAIDTQMEQKALDKARAEGRHPNLRLCRMCRDLSKILQPTSDGFELTAKSSFYPFGNYHQLKCRRNCAVCNLILSTITTKSGELHPRLGAIDREVQGTRLSTGTLSTKEKVMRFDYGMRHVGELRVLTSQNFTQALRQAWQMDARSSLSAILSDLKGPVYDTTQQQINLQVIKSWLNNCDHNHGSECNNLRSGTRAEKEMPLIFIDVIQQCLVPASSDAKYLALSYVWGQVDMSKTLKANYHERQQPLALLSVPFPKTIRDAMTFVKSLGERFLWVDAICMVQDDKEQMARDIPNMDIVYGQAFATIVALEGNDADAGLPGVAPGTRAPQRIGTITISDRSPILDDDPASQNKETVSLVATPRPFYLALELSRWNTRGWIVQERLLSRRCLYFAPDTVYFQCSRQTLSEGGVNEDFGASLLDKPPVLDDHHVLRQANQDNPLLDLDTMYDLPLSERLSKAFNAYKILLETYSRRNLSFKSDILNAFAGMFAILEGHFQSITFHGLPPAVFSHALLWAPAARVPRRGRQLPTYSSMGPGSPDAQFPSWSWAGWDVYETINGPISDIVDKGKGLEKSTSNIDTVSAETKDSRGSTSGSIEGQGSNDRQVLAKIVPDPIRGTSWVVMPPPPMEKRNDPHIAAKMLRFKARAVPVPSFRILPNKEYLSNQSQVHVRTAQAVRRIYDHNGKHCGLWWEQAGYGYVGLGMSPDAESKIGMVEISRYGDAYRRRKGPSRVEGPIPLFDEETFPAVGAGSGLVNILAVDWDMGLPDGIGERCTVAVIHSKAWEAAGPKEKEICLV